MHVVGTTGKLLVVPLLLVEQLGLALGPVAAPLLLRSETVIVKGFARGSLIDAAVVVVVVVAAAVSDIVDVTAAVAANAVSETAVAIAVGT